MEISVTGPRAVNELGGPVIPGTYVLRFQANLGLNKIPLNFVTYLVVGAQLIN